MWCIWVTYSVCLFSPVLSTSPLIAVSLTKSFTFAFWIPYWLDSTRIHSPSTALNASRGSEVPSRPHPNLKVKTWHKSAASGLLSTQEHAGSPGACASLLLENYIQPTMTCSWQLHLFSSPGRQQPHNLCSPSQVHWQYQSFWGALCSSGVVVALMVLFKTEWTETKRMAKMAGIWASATA